jgi:excisionase family DNA binding protein
MEQHNEAGTHRVGWSLAEISEAVGLSLGYLRNEVRAKRLPVKRFGRRVVVRDEDFKLFLERGSQPSHNLPDAA